MQSLDAQATLCYQGASGQAFWSGRRVEDADVFRDFMVSAVGPRLRDDEGGFDDDINAITTTGMDGQFVSDFLDAVPKTKPWEAGEALAESILASRSDRTVSFPWNTARDRRTPLASLPGADLIGFVEWDGEIRLFVGEAKTSGDRGAPPNVMYGKSGMAWQLVREATDLKIHRSLLEWLHARCRDGGNRRLYELATARYLRSRGTDWVLCGFLMRDTEPEEADLESRGRSLGEQLVSLTAVELGAWYLPIRIAEWPKLVQEEAR